MSIRVVQMFALRCDKCEEDLLADNDIAVFGGSADIKTHAEQSGWEFYSNKWYCYECISEAGTK